MADGWRRFLQADNLNKDSWKIYINLDNFVLLFSALIVTGSIYFSTSGKMESFASVAINLFGSMVFSWLLTKKSSRVEFKQQEEELALRSFRHINYIDSAAPF
jgi:membrane protein YdbS with pleckstrin-like domain